MDQPPAEFSILRRLAIKAMLWSIGLSALLGVLAVLFSGYIAAEILLSGGLTALACLLAAGLSRLARDERWRRSVLLGLGVIVAEYVVLLLLIWELHERVGLGREFRDQVLASCWDIGLAGGAGVFLLRAIHAPALRIAAWIGLVAASTAAVVGFVAIWGMEGDDRDRMGFTSLTIALCGGMALLSVAGRRWRPGPLGGLSWRWVGLGASAVSLVLGLIVLWGEFRDTEGVARALTAFVGAGVSVVHANLMGLLRLPGGQRWLTRAAWAAVTVALGATALLMHDVRIRIGGTEYLARLAGAAAIVGGCATLAAVVLDAVQRRTRPKLASSADAPTVRVECPRCLTLAERPAGTSACGLCGLTLMIRTEAPACLGCGYPLSGLRGEVCPECGRRRDAPAERPGRAG